MPGCRIVAVMFFVIIALLTVSTSQAQFFPALPNLMNGDSIVGPCKSYGAFGLRKYINSFTSYQFPGAPPSIFDPVSRLEWPWEQLFYVARLGGGCGCVQINLELAGTLDTFTNLKAQDSDWIYLADTDQKSIFSQGQAKPRGWTLDTSLSCAVPGMRFVRAIGGFRAQNWGFTYTDVTQSVAFSPFGPVLGPTTFGGGPGIEFTEAYKIWYGGGIIILPFDLGFLSSRLSSYQLFISGQGDYGYTTGKNFDFHIRRVPAPRYTWEDTSGGAWHVNLTLGCRANNRVAFTAEGDLIGIRTRGKHNWTQPGTNRNWDGAQVWSEQKYLTFAGILSF